MSKLFEGDISKTAEDLGYFYRRLRDMTFYKGSSSPCDFIIWEGNVFLAIECKEISGKSSSKSLSFDEIKKDQYEGLQKVNKFTRSLGVYLINFRNVNYSAQVKGKGKVFIVNPDDLLKVKDDIIAGKYKDTYPRNKKSIPLDWFKNNCTQLPRLKLNNVGGYGWDIPMLNYYYYKFKNGSVM